MSAAGLTWTRRVVRLAALVWWGALASAHAQVTIVGLSGNALSTAGGPPVRISVRTELPGALVVHLLTGDGDVARSLRLPAPSAGVHELSWDGLDNAGQPVPDEAYTPRAVLVHAGGEAVHDPRLTSGGETVAGLEPAVTSDGSIAYQLSAPARVLIRVGIKGGAMVRSLSVWQPRPAGRNLQRWNGYDEEGVVDLRRERLAMLAAAFRLPDHAILTSGRPDIDYRAWRLTRGFGERPDTPTESPASQPLVRDGQRIARQHYMPRYKDREPRIEVRLSDMDGKVLQAGAPLPTLVRVAVDLHPDDRWLMQESLYEVGFFVNGEFVSEEENGYVPIGWIWNTDQLAAGRHLLTVNLTGFTGRVGAKTLAVSK